MFWVYVAGLIFTFYDGWKAMGREFENGCEAIVVACIAILWPAFWLALFLALAVARFKDWIRK